MKFKLSIVVRDAKAFHVLASRVVLQHASRLLLESFLEVRNDFIARLSTEERAKQNDPVLISFLVQPVENV